MLLPAASSSCPMDSEAVGDLSVPSPERESQAVRGEPDHRYDLLDEGVLDNPYPLYDELRVAAPVYRDRRFFGCILTRYDVVVAVLKDSRVSSRRPTADERIPRSLSAIAEQLRELRAFQSRWMLYLDPPEHTRLRSLVSKAFTATTVASMRQTIQGLVDELLAPGCEAERLDVVRDLARPLPALVIADLLGRARADR